MRFARISNPTLRPGVPRERIGIDTEPLKDGDEELRERKFFRRYLASPSCITDDSSTGLIIFIPIAKLKMPAISEAEVLSTGGNNRIVARKVETAGS